MTLQYYKHGDVMASKRTTAGTPLHLLQQLSSSMLQEFEKACRDAQDQAEKALAEFEKQRARCRTNC